MEANRRAGMGQEAYTIERLKPNHERQIQHRGINSKWPAIFDRIEWADGVVLARKYRGPTAAVFHRMTARSGFRGRLL